jgi:OOP family OmpA-OmpF porin
MKKIGIVITSSLLGCLAGPALADEAAGNLYIGLGLSSLALDDERVPAFSTRSPSHTPKIGSLILGYQFNERWSMDLNVGADMGYERNVDKVSLNGYRFFGENWRTFISAGISQFDVETAPIDKTDLLQAGVGVSKDFTDQLEFRLGYQHFYAYDDSFNDDEFNVSLNWHFRKPKAAPAPEPAPEPVAAPAPVPVPAPAPVEKVVVDVFELLVQFDFDKSDVNSVYRPQFDEIASILAEYPDTNLTIEGHTCSIGTDEYNQGLSERRANSVRDVFINEHGVDPNRIDAQGYGEAQPVADNATREGRVQNRRALGVLKRERIVTE